MVDREYREHGHDPRHDIPTYAPPRFDHAQFLGFVQSVSSAKFGGARIVIDVHASERDEAWKLVGAIGPTPLSFDVLRWRVPDEDPGPFARAAQDRGPGGTPEPGP